jgi:hypothetical protein
MRDWLNSIFVFIGTTSLTDEEYDSINFLNLTSGTYNQAAYDELSKVLSAREAVSSLQERLVALFKVKGVDVTPAETGKSNILIGMVLE